MNVLERSRLDVKKEVIVKWALLLIVGTRGRVFASVGQFNLWRLMFTRGEGAGATPAGSGQDGEGVFRNFRADWLRAC